MSTRWYEKFARVAKSSVSQFGEPSSFEDLPPTPFLTLASSVFLIFNDFFPTHSFQFWPHLLFYLIHNRAGASSEHRGQQRWEGCLGRRIHKWQQNEGLLLGKARGQKDEGTCRSGGMRGSEQTTRYSHLEIADVGNALHRMPRGILVFRPHKAEQFPLVLGCLLTG